MRPRPRASSRCRWQALRCWRRSAAAQRGGPPNEDTPYILVSTFHSNDRGSASKWPTSSASALAGEHSARELYVIHEEQHQQHARSLGLPSGFGAQRVGPHGAREAAPRRVRHRRHGQQDAATAFMSRRGSCMRTGQQRSPSRCRRSTARTPATRRRASRTRSATRARRMPPYKTCLQRPARAEVRRSGRGRAAGYDRVSELLVARVCLLSALVDTEGAAGLDHQRRRTRFCAIDPTQHDRAGEPRRRLQGQGRHDEGDRDEPRASIALDPTNTAHRRLDRRRSRQLRRAGQGAPDHRLAAQGQPGRSADAEDEVAAAAPREPVQERDRDRRGARQGRYGGRDARLLHPQIGAAQSDSNAAAVQQFAAKAAQKFPNDASFRCCSRRAHFKTGQLQQALEAARRATPNRSEGRRARGCSLLAAQTR